ncbi:MAG: hypothetical protein K2N16_06730 [Muribaculaceae bacterium]|nr:hypothetical protein [Muribaculaceae bacterium]
MKHIAFAVCIAVAVSCSSPEAQPMPENVRAAIEHGRADAGKAIKAQPGSQEREQAILRIRANQQKINEAGDSAAADAYARAAEERLDSAGIL